MFGGQGDEQRMLAILASKATARKLFDAPEEDVVLVDERRCTEPGCPPLGHPSA
jgi:hypothetical protein